jgi:fatty-acyl-CoA synthase
MSNTGDQFNLGRVVEVIAEAIPDRPVLIHGDQVLSYAELALRSRALGAVLANAGIGVNTERSSLAGHESGQDHVALALYNSPEYLEGMVGSYLARSAPFNVNYRYVGAELSYLLNDAKPKAIIFHSSLAPTLAPLLAELPSVQLLLQVADESGEALLPGAIDYHQALEAALGSAPQVETSPDDLYVLYTGGTTGMPKGVLWRQHDIFKAAMGGREIGTWKEVMSYDELADNARNGMGLKVMMLPPLMHGAAQWATFIMMSSGGVIVFPDDARRLDPQDVWKSLERHGVNTFTIVGDAMLRPLLDEYERGDYDASSLLAVGNGGAPLTASARERLTALLPTVFISDNAGSSETGAQMSAVAGGGAGQFVPGPGTTVVDEAMERILEAGEDAIGWLAQGGWVPLGYLGDAEKTERTFPMVKGQRYAIPGDRARLLADGTIELLGRDAVTINSGGEKIFAEEVEGAIAGHPEVVDVIVAGRPSERWGQEVVAVVALRPGVSVSPQSIIEHASKLIARYKLPKDVVFVDEVLRSPSGKADYRWAREQAEGKA